MDTYEYWQLNLLAKMREAYNAAEKPSEMHLSPAAYQAYEWLWRPVGHWHHLVFKGARVIRSETSPGVLACA